MTSPEPIESQLTDSRLLIDEFLPSYDFTSAHKTLINASAAVVEQRLLATDFNDVWIVRTLMSLRTGRRIRPYRRVPDLRQRLQGTGFMVLGEVPNEEVVIGVAGQFWHPDGGRCLDLTPAGFVNFSQPGYAKAAWNFVLKAESPESTFLSTETRIQCFGSALWKFRLYWNAIRPFSGLIRKAVLRRVKINSESAL